MTPVQPLIYKDCVEKIKTILQNDAEFVFILGSFGTEFFRDDSDIDIAVYYKNHVDEKIKTKLWNQVEDLTGRDVQLVELNKIDPIFAMQVIDKGRLILDQDKACLLNWKSLYFSKYQDLKLSRKVVEKNLLGKGNR